MKIPQIVILLIVGILIFYTGNHIGELYNSADGDYMQKLNVVLDGIESKYDPDNIYISKNRNDLLVGGGFFATYIIAIMYYMVSKKIICPELNMAQQNGELNLILKNFRTRTMIIICS